MLTKTLNSYCNLFLKNFDRNGLKIFLESSRHYPNLLSVLQTLRYIGLESHAGQCDWGYLKDLDTPFLMHTNKDEKEKIIIAKWDNQKGCLKLYNENNRKWEKLRQKDIEHYWDGIVIYTTAPTVRLSIFNRIDKEVFVIVFVLLIALGFLLNPPMIMIPIIIGLILSMDLFFRTGKQYDSPFEGLCHITKLSDCKNVSESRYSNIFGIRLNVLAVSFFVSMLICFCLGNTFHIPEVNHSLSYIAALAIIPMMAYSLYGQYKIKRICPLCLVTIGCVLWLAMIFVFNVSLSVNSKIIVVFSGITPITFLTFQYISNLLTKNKHYQNDRIRMLRILRKEDILLHESKPVDNIVTPLKFGDETSKIKITTIISPSCNHCRKTVKDVMDIINSGVKLQWQIVLGETSKHCAEIIDVWCDSYTKDRDSLFNQMYLWSCGNNQNVKSNKSNGAMVTGNYGMFFREQLSNLAIGGFPRIILNDRLLSTVYSSKDLEFLIYDQYEEI